MGNFSVSAVVKGFNTNVIVEEPRKWEIPEFLISVRNTAINENFFIRLNRGLWQHTMPENYMGVLPTVCSLDPLEIEAIGLEIAKNWRERLSKTLQVFDQLF